MSLLIPLTAFISFISLAMFFSLAKKSMMRTAFFFNLLACLSVLTITSFVTEYMVGDLIRISDLKIKYVLILSCFSIFQIILNGYKVIENVRASILSNLMFIIAVILLGAKDFIIFYIAIALMSILTTLLPAIANPGRNLSKRWVLELYQNMIMLVAVVFYYAGTGSLWVEAKVTNDNLFLFSYCLIFIVLCFKMGVFPFHNQVMSQKIEGGGIIISKNLLAQMGVCFVLIFLLSELFKKLLPDMQEHVSFVVAFIAVVSVFYGHFVSLIKGKVRDVVSGSIIAQGAYLLVTIVYIDDLIKEKLIVYYLVQYLMSVAGILIYINKPHFMENKLSGLFYRDKFSALLLLILLLNLAAFPLTAGFAAKYVLILELLKLGHYMLVGAFFISLIVNVYYIVKIAMSIYAKNDEVKGRWEFINLDGQEKTIIGIMAIFIICSGVFPRFFL